MSPYNTCPNCQTRVHNYKCTNRDCNYTGVGETPEQRANRWATQHNGVWDRTSGGNAYGHYED